MPSASLWAFLAEIKFLYSCLSRPAGRSKQIFTNGVEIGNSRIRTNLLLTVLPFSVKMQSRKVRRLSGIAIDKIILPLSLPEQSGGNANHFIFPQNP
jgi:hypothetical protein